MTQTSSQPQPPQSMALTKTRTQSVFIMTRDATRSRRDRRHRSSPRPTSASKVIKKYHQASGLSCSLKAYVRDILGAPVGHPPERGSLEWACISWKKGR